MLDLISVVNLLRLVLWTDIRCSLGNVQCVLEKIVYSAYFGWDVLYIYIYIIYLFLFSMNSNVSFMANVSLLIFCLDDLSNGVK